ncbi:MAG: ABC transporter substrate-binding protein, partial [Bdellovibrionota bacterium]
QALKYTLICLSCLQISLFSFANSVDRIIKNGELVVGSDGSCLPYELRKPDSQWVGFEVDLMEAFARHLKVKLKFVDTSWDGLVPALVAKKFDMVASDLPITEERKKFVLFTHPYYKVQIGAVILNENKLKFTNKDITELNENDLNIAVQMGTSASIMAKKYFPKANVIVYQNQDIASQSLLFKKVDVLYYEENYLKQFVKRNSTKVSFISGRMGELYLAAAARKEDSELIDEFNKFYTEYKNSPEYKKSYTINFEVMPWI